MDYTSTTRTNYFRVTDEERYRKLVNNLSGERFKAFHDKDDLSLHAFGADSSVSWYLPASTYDEIRSVYDAGDTLYDDNGKPVDFEDIDMYESLYDSKGNEAYDKYMNDNILCFVKELVKILPEDECFVLIESGHEGWRYVTGYALVATRNDMRSVDLDSFINKSVKELLGPEASTRWEY